MTLKQLIFWPSSKMNLTFGSSDVYPFLFRKSCLWIINNDSYSMIYFSAEDEVKFNSSIVTKLQIDLDRNDRFLSEGNDQIFSIIDSSKKLYSTKISGAWARLIYGKLIQPKFMGTYSVLFEFGAWARLISGKLIQQSILEFWCVTQADFWKTHPKQSK